VCLLFRFFYPCLAIEPILGVDVDGIAEEVIHAQYNESF
jgi:hypothetical protein